MNFTDVKVRLIKDEEKLKAVASVSIDNCIVIHDIKIIDGKEGLFISMPNKKTPDGKYRDIVHPINNETREALKKAILTAYESALKEQE